MLNSITMFAFLINILLLLISYTIILGANKNKAEKEKNKEDVEQMECLRKYRLKKKG